MTMNCERTRELLPWLLNGTLAEPERGEVGEHLASCDACRAELSETRLAGRIFAAHLEADELVAYAFDEPTALGHERIAAHLAICSRCAEELELVAQSRRLCEREGAEGGEILPFQRPAEAPPAPRQLLWQWAAMAAGLTALIAAGGWMWSWNQSESLAGRLAEARRGGAAAAERLADVERRAEELGAVAAEARDRVARLEEELAGRAVETRRTPAPRLHLNTPVIDLFPGDVVVRGGEAPRTARDLPQSAELVTLILNVDSREEFAAYELRVVDAGGATVRRERGLARDPETGGFTVSLPVALLGTGRATIEIYGLGAEGATRLASYPVEVSG